MSRAFDDNVERVRTFYKRDPGLATAAVVAGAAAVGAIVWGLVRLYTR
jgi:hypothetical protein